MQHPQTPIWKIQSHLEEKWKINFMDYANWKSTTDNNPAAINRVANIPFFEKLIKFAAFIFFALEYE